MANEVSGEQMQAKIATARRDAEGLKDRIKRKKDELADTNRKFSEVSQFVLHAVEEVVWNFSSSARIFVELN